MITLKLTSKKNSKLQIVKKAIVMASLQSLIKNYWYEEE